MNGPHIQEIQWDRVYEIWKMQRIEGYNVLFSTNIRCIYFLKGNFFDKSSFDGQHFWNTVLMTGNVSRQKATLMPSIVQLWVYFYCDQ